MFVSAVNRLTRSSAVSSGLISANAAANGYNFTYVYDPSQGVGRAYGATRTPEFYVLDKDRKIVYMGALDDSMNADGVKKTYVADALDAVLKGGTVEVSETRPVG